MDAALLARVLLGRRRLRHHERWPRSRIEAHQTAALRALRDFAYARSPFYRRFHEGLRDRPLHELPVLTKATLMESFDEVSTDRSVRLADVQAYLEGPQPAELFLGRYQVAATAGTTGRRGVFLWDPREWGAVLASYARANEWAGLSVGLTRRMKLAVVSSRVWWHQSARVGASLASRLVPTLRLDATAPLEDTVAALNRFQPESLVAYASMAQVLAQEQLAGRLRIAPAAVMCASEVLHPAWRRRIREAWGADPFNVYAATETAGIAAECELHSGMHLYEDLVITEVVDDQDRPVPPGEYGAKTLVTVLFSRTLPLIRYELSDSIRLSPATCPCGRTFALLDGVRGRRQDALELPGRNGERVSIYPNVLQRALERIEAGTWQIVQEPDAIRLLVVAPREGLDDGSLAEALAREVEAQGALAPPIHVERVGSLARTRLGKAPLIQASPPDGAPRSTGR